jgi:hypothetical protein
MENDDIEPDSPKIACRTVRNVVVQNVMPIQARIQDVKVLSYCRPHRVVLVVPPIQYQYPLGTHSFRYHFSLDLSRDFNNHAIAEN